MPKQKKKGETVIDIMSFEETLTLDDGETKITVGFNRDKYEWILEYLPILKYNRGIIDATTSIDAESTRLMRQKAKREQRSDISMNDLVEVRRQVSGVMNTATDQSLAELITAIVLDYEDVIFEFDEIANGVTVKALSPFDLYEIPDWYFKDPNADKKSLKAMMQRAGQYIPSEPTRNPQNPLDVMCGIAAGIIESNPKFARQFRKLVEKASIMQIMGETVIAPDERDYFLQTIKTISLDVVSDNNSDDDGQDTQD